MNREIKFRAWDTIDNKMRYENDVEGTKDYLTLLAIGFHGLPIAITEDSFSENEIIGWNRDHNLKLMQYTGFKDKNGKEVYEGDILKTRYDDFNILTCEVVFESPSFSRKWLNKFTINLRGQKVEKLPWNTHIIYEIIGNIHENPELVGENNG